MKTVLLIISVFILLVSSTSQQARPFEFIKNLDVETVLTARLGVSKTIPQYSDTVIRLKPSIFYRLSSFEFVGSSFAGWALSYTFFLPLRPIVKHLSAPPLQKIADPHLCLLSPRAPPFFL